MERCRSFIFNLVYRAQNQKGEIALIFFGSCTGGRPRRFARFGHYLLAVSVPANEPHAVFYGRVRVVWGVDKPDAFLNCPVHMNCFIREARSMRTENEVACS